MRPDCHDCRVERESFEAHDKGQLPRCVLLIHWQKLPLRETTLECHRNDQDNSPVILGSTIHKAGVQGVVKWDQIVVIVIKNIVTGSPASNDQYKGE